MKKSLRLYQTTHIVSEFTFLCEVVGETETNTFLSPKEPILNAIGYKYAIELKNGKPGEISIKSVIPKNGQFEVFFMILPPAESSPSL